ncbi:dATP/dGTP pyrophosphohydrolase domain-containing protein [Escherichia coli]
MSTFTKEWLQNTITSIESARDEMPFGLDNDQAHMLTAFKIALASLEREQIRHEHAKWSDSTFGCVGPIGPLKHLSKEALEAAAEPDDLSEWADMQFLLWDAQRRAGISDAEITAAMENKLKINMERQWPEPKDGEPRLHIKERGNSPVTPGGWISCSDRMPEDTKMLLAFSQGEIVAAYWNWVVNPIDYKKYRAFTYLSGNILDDVTHWMPLPEPPQEVNRG